MHFVSFQFRVHSECMAGVLERLCGLCLVFALKFIFAGRSQSLGGVFRSTAHTSTVIIIVVSDAVVEGEEGLVPEERLSGSHKHLPSKKQVKVKSYFPLFLHWVMGVLLTILSCLL